MGVRDSVGGQTRRQTGGGGQEEQDGRTGRVQLENENECVPGITATRHWAGLCHALRRVSVGGI